MWSTPKPPRGWLLRHEAASIEVLGGLGLRRWRLPSGVGRPRLARHHQAGPSTAGRCRRLHGGRLVVDDGKETVTCPGRQTVALTPTRRDVFGALCRGCALRDRCTTAPNGRTLNVDPTTPCSPRLDAKPRPPRPRPSTATSARWCNAPGAGWCAVGAAGSPIGAWRGNGSGRATGWPW
jgi:hypothetical protein